MGKKQLNAICDAFDKSTQKKPVEGPDYASVSFNSTDCICTTSNGGVHINARVDFKEFDSIIDTNLLYILEYLKSKKFNISCQ